VTTMRTATSRRSTRGAALALLTGAGILLSPMAAQAAPAAATAISAPSHVVAPTAAAQRIVDAALAQRGTSYAWGGSSPRGFDCSGLVQFAARAAGITVPRTSRVQATVGRPVSRADLRPGDLVFFYTPVAHVGIYIGDGKMVHAPTAGDVVRVASVDRMWGYNSARRIA
jgi:cell wall-associated NlpC family hydrolase